MKYKLLINEKQAKIISFALDLYSRTAGGQFEDIYYRFNWKDLNEQDQNKAVEMLTDLKCMLTGIGRGQPNVGIKNLCEDGKIAYDLHQVVRYRLANDNPGKFSEYSVDFSNPMKMSSEPLAKIEQQHNPLLD